MGSNAVEVGRDIVVRTQSKKWRAVVDINFKAVLEGSQIAIHRNLEAREAAERGDGGTAGVALIVDRRGSGLRNQDPALLRALLPALTKNFPYSLHTAYVAPINVVFYAIWAVARLVLPKAVTARFTLLTGDGYADRLRERLGPDVAARLNAVESKWASQCVVDECLEAL